MMVNSILDSGEMAIIGIVLCGMLVLAAIMLPKIMRYRKRMKAKQEAKPDDAEIFVVQENDTEETAANK
jgi:flagellar biosynthesis/type III secretory pathway M-ring protein FliF/YscJ